MRTTGRRTNHVGGARVGLAAALLVTALVSGAEAQGQGRMGGHGPGMIGGDARQQADMELFHLLLDHGTQIRRTVTARPDGVETLTESDDANLADKLRVHVASMAARLRDVSPIHMRDPLFREVFAHAGEIAMTITNTPNGIKVVETSADPYVVKLIQAHAAVISLFAKNGRSEAMKDHDVPMRD